MSRLVITREGVPQGIVALPVRTRLIGEGDDLTAIVRDAVTGIARGGDVLCIAETAVAIAQGRFIPAEYIRPSKLAFALARRAGALATVAQPESMQLVIDDVGAPRVLYAVAAGAVGRLLGKRGIFYEILGEAIAAIDGYTGTLPPYERAIVLGPEKPDDVSQQLADALGCHAAVIDANDLQKAHVLGASRGVNRALLQEAMRANPHGNADQQTPLVILKWRGQGPNPLLAHPEAA
ncbi:MAG TPA: coenzyme F420-0:L-glutamate ligase [Candidatus Dormibacteraeota bacterium]|nr:coenzyme F420-0:L-glutamate ligase [Candidatus Dormibacteraeota bacterium]